jgi:disulfide bond formation protein DsbB
VLLDGYQLDIEQFVLAETLTDVLLVGGLAILLWRRRLTAPLAAAAGVLLAAVAVTRDATLPVVVVVGVYLLVRRRWLPFLLYGGAAAAVVVAYGFWYASVWGHFGLQSSPGYFLYGRVASFATCDYQLSAEEQKLCPKQPVSQRPDDQDYYSWLPGSPLHQPGLGSEQARSTLAEKFSEQVILHQPLAYLEAVARDTWHNFVPGHSVPRSGEYMDSLRWAFPGPHLDPYSGVKVNGDLFQMNIFFANVGFNGRKVTDRLHPSLIGSLQTYQKIVYTQGPLLLACLIGAIAVSLGLRRPGTRRRQARWAALLLAVSGLAMAVTPAATTGFTYRYQLPLLVLLPPAGILAADIAAEALGRLRGQRRCLAERRSNGRPAAAARVAAPVEGFDGSRDPFREPTTPPTMRG